MLIEFHKKQFVKSFDKSNKTVHNFKKVFKKNKKTLRKKGFYGDKLWIKINKKCKNKPSKNIVKRDWIKSTFLPIFLDFLMFFLYNASGK